ncbi:hypothetical protein KFL_008130010 [Klebsormidium nitens]|uniref:Uncharacterized protein n=1 Tax=Klebsormidium nitens TaxID=105231 RepID=A0A1Y1ISG0_KLENI|nr:hypothetical protein KFL_008130010 [Klebsormidium nitens]|eukprot:GAQ91587.1 hypothetical protein KFL_008130010 [Klebsormidium nitens]
MEAKAKEAAKRKRQPRVDEYVAAKKARRQSQELAKRAAHLRREKQKKMFRSFPHEEDHIHAATADNYKAGRRAYQRFFQQRDGVRYADITAEGVRTFFKETPCNKPPTLDKYARGLQWTLHHLWLCGGKQGPKPNSRAFPEVKEKLKTEKKDTARRREEEQVDKHDELTDQLSPEEWEQFQRLQLEYASLSKEELRGTGTTPVGFLQAW